MANTTDGFTWTSSVGLRHGLPSIGVVNPPTNLSSVDDVSVHDVIVVGAGYAGLVAARDLSTQGNKTLLLEARDRLGGRTWHATIDGFNYEMGGTWVHWHMPHIYREISLYGLHNDWITTQNPGGKEDYCTLTSYGHVRNISHAEEDEMFGRAWRLFCNVDGNDVREPMKYVFGTSQDPGFVAKWDKLSCRDRLEQIRPQLSLEELGMLEGLLQQMGGGSLEQMGLWDALRWWALGSHEPTGLNDIALHTRLRSGNSELHRRIFTHAVSSGNLDYKFGTPIQRVEEGSDGIVTVTTRDGALFKAKKVICTVPLNVLSSIEFSPSLEPGKQAAAEVGSVNKCNKFHIDLNGPDWLSWSAFASPGKGMLAAFGDHLTPAYNSHIVGFGPDPSLPNGICLDDIDAIKEAALHLLPKNARDKAVINRIVSHDWNKDEFSKGTWCYLPPEVTTKYLDALQRPHGNVFFASADWSDGWRGWIDGAVQSGMQAAHVVSQSLREENSKASTNGFNGVKL